MYSPEVSAHFDYKDGGVAAVNKMARESRKGDDVAAMLEVLGDGPCSRSELLKELGWGQDKLSRLSRELRDEGVVEIRQQNPRSPMMYRRLK